VFLRTPSGRPTAANAARPSPGRMSPATVPRGARSATPLPPACRNGAHEAAGRPHHAASSPAVLLPAALPTLHRASV